MNDKRDPITIDQEVVIVDDTQVDDTQVDDTQVDGTQVDDTQVDDTQADDTQADDTQVDDTQVERTTLLSKSAIKENSDRKEIWDKHSKRGTLALTFIKSVVANQGIRQQVENKIITFCFALADEMQKVSTLSNPQRGTIAVEIVTELLKKQGIKSSAEHIAKYAVDLSDKVQAEINLQYNKEIAELDK